jgi:hypothetical protein
MLNRCIILLLVVLAIPLGAFAHNLGYAHWHVWGNAGAAPSTDPCDWNTAARWDSGLVANSTEDYVALAIDGAIAAGSQKSWPVLTTTADANYLNVLHLWTTYPARWWDSGLTIKPGGVLNVGYIGSFAPAPSDHYYPVDKKEVNEVVVVDGGKLQLNKTFQSLHAQGVIGGPFVKTTWNIINGGVVDFNGVRTNPLYPDNYPVTLFYSAGGDSTIYVGPGSVFKANRIYSENRATNDPYFTDPNFAGRPLTRQHKLIVDGGTAIQNSVDNGPYFCANNNFFTIDLKNYAWFETLGTVIIGGSDGAGVTQVPAAKGFACIIDSGATWKQLGTMNWTGVPTNTADPNYNNFYIDIRGGTYMTTLNATTCTAYIASKRFRAYGGRSTVVTTDLGGGNWRAYTAVYLDTDAAYNPKPADKDVNTISVANKTVTMTWSAGDTATGHQVYFGENATDVNNATPSSSLFRVTKALGSRSYNPTTESGITLVPGKTYYWRIDETRAGNTPYKGKVWAFRVNSCITVDNFESYTGSLGSAWSGAAISLETAAANVAAGTKSMRFDYGPVDATYTFTANQDWSTTVKALSLTFVGTRDNTSGSAGLAFQLVDADNDYSAKVYYPNNGDLNAWGWMTFNAKLSDFTVGAPAFNLTKVKSIIISIDAGGTGTLFMDDLRVCAPRCVGELSDDIATGTSSRFPNCLACEGDIRDIQALADAWQKSGYAVTPTDPGTSQLKVRYTFDSQNYDDSSGNGYNGTNYTYTGRSCPTTPFRTDTPSGSGYSVEFLPTVYSGRTITPKIRVPHQAFNVTDPCEFSMTMWLKGDPSYLPVARGTAPANYGIVMMGHFVPTSAAPNWNAWEEPFRLVVAQTNATTTTSSGGDVVCSWYIHPCTLTGSTDAAGGRLPEEVAAGGVWNHWAITHSVSKQEICIYLNGKLLGKSRAVRPAGWKSNVSGYTIANFSCILGGSHILNNMLTDYKGWMDDYRLYSKVLTPNEVAYVAGVSAFTQPLLETDADNDGNGTIGFGDLSLFLQNAWLKESLWP